ncbi:MAG: hypothetical protein Q8O30_01640 [Candidatus Omnitrophota bacterium]|nr:hypothetical protein [Candidatus Omnitrophota bacterium]
MENFINNASMILLSQFIKTPKGLLLNGYSLDMGDLAKATATIEYQEIEGLKLPKSLAMQNIKSGTQQNFDLTFLNFQIKKGK